MTEVVVSVAGWVGAVSVLAGYALVASGRLSPRGSLFHVLNLCGAVLLLLNSAYYGAWPSAGVNGVWLAIGAVALIAARSRRSRTADPDISSTERNAP